MSGRNKTSLIAASRAGQLAHVRALLARGARRDRIDRSLIGAAHFGHAKVVRLLLAAGADVRASGGKALRMACLTGRVAVADALLRAGARVANDVLWKTVYWTRRTDIVVCLLNAGVVDHSGRALCVAANHNLPDIVALLAPCAHPTALRDALEGGLCYPKVVALLLAGGATLKPHTLVRALDHPRFSISVVRMLLAAGAGGLTDAMVSAAVRGYTEIVELLLAAGADAQGRSLRAAVTYIYFAE